MIRTTSICASFLYNYVLTNMKSGDTDSIQEQSDFSNKCLKIKCLAKTLQNYGGVLSKLSQILSLDNENSDVFSNCKPFSKKETIQYLKDNFKHDLITNIDYNVYKSGSVGQVHKAIYKNKKIIIKVQYVGLEEQTKIDLELLDKIISYIYCFTDLKDCIDDIKIKMNEELDYVNEGKNQMMLYNIYKKHDFIKIPKILKKFSTDKILCMNYIRGQSLNTFIENATMDEKNKLGFNLFTFIFECLFKNNILYSDIHYGNFLIQQNSKLVVLDFGCITYIDDILKSNLIKLYTSLLNKDEIAFFSIISDLGICIKQLSDEMKTYMYDYFLLQFEPLLSDNFTFTDEWLHKCSQKNPEYMKDWILPKNMVYLNKIPYGSYHIFTKLQLHGNFKEIIHKYIF